MSACLIIWIGVLVVPRVLDDGLSLTSRASMVLTVGLIIYAINSWGPKSITTAQNRPKASRMAGARALATTDGSELQ